MYLYPSNSIRLRVSTLASRALLFGVAIVGALFCPALPGLAQVQGTLFQGTVRPVLAQAAGGWCAAELGPTSFRRISNGLALMSVPALHYTLPTASGATYYTLSGEARLIFSSASAGTVRFDEPKSYPADVLRPTFSNYTETYTAASGLLIVRLRINFPNCSVIFYSTHRS